MQDFYNINREYKKFFSAKTRKEQDEAIDSLVEKMKLMKNDLDRMAKELEESHKKYGKAYVEALLTGKLYSAIINQLMPGVEDKDIDSAIKKFKNTFILKDGNETKQ